jgi:2-(1,2-epoxy-1,2-dihydrophenyl)acetyl-CoA isomerase
MNRSGDDQLTKTLETGTDRLLAEVQDGVALITLNRSERRNALSSEMLHGLARAIDLCETDVDIKAVVLTGAGGTFCAGGDVKDFADIGIPGATSAENSPLQEQIEKQRRAQRATAGRLYAMPKPTICAIEGAAAGAGLGLLLACDLRIASRDAFMVTAFAKVGLSGDFGVTWFLTRELGKARALELLWLSERVTAERAEQLGLFNKLVTKGDAVAEAREIASTLAAGPHVAHRVIKDNVNRATESDLLTCMDLEVNEAMRCAATEDHAQAVAAFASK